MQWFFLLDLACTMDSWTSLVTLEVVGSIDFWWRQFDTQDRCNHGEDVADVPRMEGGGDGDKT